MTAARSVLTAVLLAAGLVGTAAGCGDTRGTTPAPPPAAALQQTGVDRLAGRDTALALDVAFLRTLAALRVAPTAAGAGALDGDVLVLPVTGGELTLPDPRSRSPRPVLGRVLHRGAALQLTGPDDTAVRLEDLELDPDQSRVYARLVVDGVVVAERLDVFAVGGRDMLPVRPGDGAGEVVLQGSRWALTAAGAQALSDALGVRFSPGLGLGVAETTVQVGR